MIDAIYEFFYYAGIGFIVTFIGILVMAMAIAVSHKKGE